jgi:RecA-family ATPase
MVFNERRLCLHILARKQIHILSGASGSGKTTLIQQILSRRDDTKMPFTLQGKGIAMAIMDRSAGAVEDRNKQLDITDIELYSLVGDKEFNLALIGHPNRLLTWVQSRFKKPFEILVLDPLMLLLDGTMLYEDVARSLIRLGHMAAIQNITILGTHHTSKARIETGFRRVHDRILGSGAFLGYSDTQLTLVDAPEQSTDYQSLHIKSHTSAGEVHHFKWSNEGLLLPYDPLMDAETGGKGEYNSETKAQMVTTKQLTLVLEGIGMSRAKAYRTIDKMIKSNRLHKLERGLYYLMSETETIPI